MGQPSQPLDVEDDAIVESIWDDLPLCGFEQEDDKPAQHIVQNVSPTSMHHKIDDLPLVSLQQEDKKSSPDITRDPPVKSMHHTIDDLPLINPSQEHNKALQDITLDLYTKAMHHDTENNDIDLPDTMKRWTFEYIWQTSLGLGSSASNSIQDSTNSKDNVTVNCFTQAHVESVNPDLLRVSKDSNHMPTKNKRSSENHEHEKDVLIGWLKRLIWNQFDYISSAEQTHDCPALVSREKMITRNNSTSKPDILQNDSSTDIEIIEQKNVPSKRTSQFRSKRRGKLGKRENTQPKKESYGARNTRPTRNKREISDSDTRKTAPRDQIKSTDVLKTRESRKNIKPNDQKCIEITPEKQRNEIIVLSESGSCSAYKNKGTSLRTRQSPNSVTRSNHNNKHRPNEKESVAKERFSKRHMLDDNNRYAKGSSRKQDTIIQKKEIFIGGGRSKSSVAKDLNNNQWEKAKSPKINQNLRHLLHKSLKKGMKITKEDRPFVSYVEMEKIQIRGRELSVFVCSSCPFMAGGNKERLETHKRLRHRQRI